MRPNLCVIWLLLGLFFAISSLNGVIISADPSSLPNGLQRVLSASSAGDVIQLAPGTYRGSGNYDLVVNKSVTIIGTQGSSQTVFDCEGRGRCLVISGASTTVTVQGVEFRNGAAPFFTRGAGARAVTRETTKEEDQEEEPLSSWKTAKKRSLPTPRGSSRRKRAREVVVAHVVMDLETGKTRVVPVEDYDKDNQKEKIEQNQSTDTLEDHVRTGRAQDHDTAGLEEAQTRSARTSTPPDSHGGCVFVTGGATATFVDVTMRGGRAPRGGGIAGLDAAQVTMTRSLVTKNVANTTGYVEFAAGGGGERERECVCVCVGPIPNCSF